MARSVSKTEKKNINQQDQWTMSSPDQTPEKVPKYTQKRWHDVATYLPY